MAFHLLSVPIFLVSAPAAMLPAALALVAARLSPNSSKQLQPLPLRASRPRYSRPPIRPRQFLRSSQTSRALRADPPLTRLLSRAFLYPPLHPQLLRPLRPRTFWRFSV